MHYVSSVTMFLHSGEVSDKYDFMAKNKYKYLCVDIFWHVQIQLCLCGHIAKYKYKFIRIPLFRRIQIQLYSVYKIWADTNTIIYILTYICNQKKTFRNINIYTLNFKTYKMMDTKSC